MAGGSESHVPCVPQAVRMLQWPYHLANTMSNFNLKMKIMFENWWNSKEPSLWVLKLKKVRGSNSLETHTEFTFLQVLS